MNSSVRVGFISDYQLSREMFSAVVKEITAAIPIQVVLSTQLDQCSASACYDLDLLLFDIDERATESLAWVERHQRTVDPTPVALFGRRIDEYVIDQALMIGCKGIITEDKSLDTLGRAIVALSRGEVWLQGKATRYLINRLQHEQHHTPQGAAGEPLTKRELQIITLFREHPEYSANGMADKLNVSESTLRNHLTRVYRKLGVKNRAALLNKVMRGYLDAARH